MRRGRITSQNTSEDRESDRLEAALHLYSEHREDRRHFEEQREKITHCVLLLAVAILALMKLGKGSEATDAILSGILTALGIFGAWMTQRLNQRVHFEEMCTAKCLAPIEEVGFSIEPPHRESKATQYAWIFLNLLVCAVGVVLLSWCLILCLRP